MLRPTPPLAEQIIPHERLLDRLVRPTIMRKTIYFLVDRVRGIRGVIIAHPSMRVVPLLSSNWSPAADAQTWRATEIVRNTKGAARLEDSILVIRTHKRPCRS